MENKETILRLLQAAEKAAHLAAPADVPNRGREVSRCIDTLDRLGSLSIPKKLLSSTLIGKRLEALTEHPKAAVRLMADEILDKWRNLLWAPMPSTKPNQSAHQNKSATTLLRVRLQGKVIIEATQKQCAQRNNVQQTLTAALSKVATEAKGETPLGMGNPENVAKAVEAAVFERIKDQANRNKKMRSILFNLGDPKNPDLRRKVISGEIAAERLIEMTNTEMASDAMKARIRQIEERALAKFQNESKTTST